MRQADFKLRVNLIEAVVIGRGQEESRETTNIPLNMKGKEVLLQMDVLPPYDQLKVLQGNYGLATVISAVRSMGYIYMVLWFGLCKDSR